MNDNLASGAFFVIVGVAYGLWAYDSLPIDTITNMGPGYFPLMLSVLLCLLGMIIAVRGVVAGGENLPILPWRGIFFISIAVLVFAVGAERLGIAPTVFLTVWIAASTVYGRRLGPPACIALAVSAFCTTVFSYGLGLPLPVIGSLFM